MNHLYKILKRDDNELVKRVFSAQKENQSKSDFIQFVEKYFKMKTRIILRAFKKMQNTVIKKIK